MTEIDYEVEYNNRARVPEHPEIFARWERDGATYRAEAGAEGRAEIGTKYGPSPRQTIDLFWARGGGSNAPLAMFIHGGYWRSLEPSSFSQMARGLNARGVTVAVPGYDLCPQVTIGDIITQTQTACIYLWRRLGRRIMVSGHSAGAHLAACMVATDWKAIERDVPTDLAPMGYAISGLYDLTPLLHLAPNADFSSTRPRHCASRRCSGRFPPDACSKPWSARWNPRSSCARARSSPTAGASAARKPATRKSRAQTTSRFAIL
jgi:arylformamidase